MAFYNITHTCGHFRHINIVGIEKDRQRKADYAARNLCNHCERERQISVAIDRAQTDDLPTLTGSEKQVAWAEKLRRDKLDNIARLIGVYGERVGEPKSDAFLNRYRGQSEAKWWIDNRYLGDGDLRNELLG